jgi:hypothetical protein
MYSVMLCLPVHTGIKGLCLSFLSAVAFTVLSPNYGSKVCCIMGLFKFSWQRNNSWEHRYEYALALC